MARSASCMAVAMGLFMICAPRAFGVINCNTPHVISGNTTLNDDYERTTQGFDACIQITGATTAVNMAGHKITCKSTTNLCGPAVNIASTGTIRNGEINTGTVGGSPAPWTTGVQCFNFGGGGAYTDCEVSNMLIHASSAGIVGGFKVDTTVLEDADRCIDSGTTLTSGGFYRQNFCSANTTGFAVTGPGSGTFTIERNFVRASTGTGIDIASGNIDATHNIVDAATPFDGSATMSENICSDLADCPEPTARGFSLTLDFN